MQFVEGDEVAPARRTAPSAYESAWFPPHDVLSCWGKAAIATVGGPRKFDPWLRPVPTLDSYDRLSLLLSVVSIVCWPGVETGCISACACCADTSAVVTNHRDAMPRSITTPRAIRSSGRSSRMKTGSGAMWTKRSWSH